MLAQVPVNCLPAESCVVGQAIVRETTANKLAMISKAMIVTDFLSTKRKTECGFFIAKHDCFSKVSAGVTSYRLVH